MNIFSGKYPANWEEIAREVKQAVGWKCVRCQHPHDPKAGYCLTVHHLTGEKHNCRWWNVCPLCQRCHLHIQAKVVMHRQWMLPHSEWFKPYVAGYYAHINGLPDDKTYVQANIEHLLTLGQGIDWSNQ